MTSHVVVNGLGLTYKGTVGASVATLPDVCKTPTPGGPVPLPYPNFADQKTLDKGTTTVKAKGQMVAIKGSEYSTSFGDEPGTAGGVKSSTFKKETSWITYSFDVRMDGQNACRHTDKKFHNHQNTVDLAGNLDPNAQVLGACTPEALQTLAERCNKAVNCTDGPCSSGRSPTGAECKTLGTKKHKCCEKAIKKHVRQNPQCGMESEVAYDKDTGRRLGKRRASKARSAANRAYDRHKAKYGIDSARKKKVWYKAFCKAGGSNTFIADVVIGKPPTAAMDFKFNCRPVEPNPICRMSSAQFDNYEFCTKVKPKVIACDGRDCSGCS